MAKRKAVTKKTRFEVFKRDAFTCQYCGASAPQVVLHVDHIQPASKNGGNDMLNLITSCVTCNAGKSDRLLSDHSAVLKQKAQLDELNQRREQLEMMLDWRNGLQTIQEMEMQAVESAWSSATNGYSFNALGARKIKKLLKDYGLNAVLDAIEVVTNYLEPDAKQKDFFTYESVSIAYDKIGGVCRLRSLPEWKQELYHIRNIARQRMAHGCNNYTAAILLQCLEEAYEAGVSTATLRQLASEGHSATRFVNKVQNLMEVENAESA